MKHKFDTAVVIGRFQPVHFGHMTLVKEALACAAQVVIVLGSAHQARSPKNPFTWQERERMILTALPAEDAARMKFVPMRDYYDDDRWVAAVTSAVNAIASDTRSVGLVGHKKDNSSYYLDRFPLWQQHFINSEHSLDATYLRNALYRAQNDAEIDGALAALADYAPAACLNFIKGWSTLPYFDALRTEHSELLAYRAKYGNGPFTTCDAVVVAAGHVLLVQRKGPFGKHLWALPGGFLNHERLVDGAIRELQEETTIGILPATLRQSIKEVKVFDHPGRSQRAHIISHAHLIELSTDKLPSVTAADDAEAVGWKTFEELASMESQFFEDHAHILDWFFKIFP